MKLFRTFTTLLAPRKAEFAKRLVAKRLSCAENPFLAGGAPAGTAEDKLRSVGLESIKYAVTPEATLVNVLESYWLPHIADMYFNPSAFNEAYLTPWSSDDERSEVERMRFKALVGAIEYDLTRKPDAAVHLPEFTTFLEYMRYRIRVEHPGHSLTPADGFTDAFLAYALEESRFVFASR